MTCWPKWIKDPLRNSIQFRNAWLQNIDRQHFSAENFDSLFQQSRTSSLLIIFSSYSKDWLWLKSKEHWFFYKQTNVGVPYAYQSKNAWLSTLTNI